MTDSNDPTLSGQGQPPSHLTSKFETLREIVGRDGLPGPINYESFTLVCIMYRNLYPEAMPLTPRFLSEYAKTFPWVVRAGGLTEQTTESYLERLTDAKLLIKQGKRYFIPDKELLRSNREYLNC